MRTANMKKIVLSIAIVFLMLLLPSYGTAPKNFSAEAVSTGQGVQQPVKPAPWPNATITALRHAKFTPQQVQAWQISMLNKLDFSAAYHLAKNLHVTEIGGKEITAPSNVTGMQVKPHIVSSLNIPIDSSDQWVVESSIAMNPTNPQIGYAVDTNENTGVCQVFETFNAGLTWQYGFPIYGTGTSPYCYEPEVRWSPDGAYAYFVYVDGVPNDIDLVSDTCGGRGCLNWEVLFPGNAYVGYNYDFPRIDVHQVNSFIEAVGEPSQANWVYVTVTYFDSSGNDEILFASNNNYGFGGYWGTLWSLYDCTGPDFAYLCDLENPKGGMYNTAYSGGDVLVCWYNSLADDSNMLQGKFAIQCMHSPNNGAGWYMPTFVTPGPAYAGYELPRYLCPNSNYEWWWVGMVPSIAISPDGKAHITYTASAYDQQSTANTPFATNCGDVKYVSSKPFDYDNIPVPPATTHQSWLGVKTVASGSLAQGFPTISVQVRPPLPPTPLGYRLYLFWYDAKNSPTSCTAISCNANLLYDIYMTSSDNGGTSFLAATRITQQSSLAKNGYIGQSLDSSATASIVWVTWTDRSDKLNINDYREYIYGEGVSAL